MRNLFLVFCLILATKDFVYTQTTTVTCANGASVTATTNMLSDARGGTQCDVDLTISSTIFNSGQRANYVGLGNPSYNQNIFNGNFGLSFPNTTSTTGTIRLNLPCADIAMGMIELRQGSLTGDLCGSLLLPVELVDFTTKVNSGGITLTWKTISEVNNFGFDVERSYDGVNFQKIGFTPGIGSSNQLKKYIYTDDHSQFGVIYYRLKQIDYDGVIKNSSVISTSFLSDLVYEDINVFPTLASDYVEIDLKGQTPKSQNAYITNQIGQLVVSLTVEVDEKSKRIDIKDLPQGYYFLTFIDQNSTKSYKFFKR